jgi:hypothetical protein
MCCPLALRNPSATLLSAQLRTRARLLRPPIPVGRLLRGGGQADHHDQQVKLGNFVADQLDIGGSCQVVS